MRKWGATERDIQRLYETQQDGEDEASNDVNIFFECQAAVKIFLSMAHQWEIQPMTGQRLCLKWPTVETAIRNNPAMLGKPKREKVQLFADIQEMEIAALIELRSQERKQKAHE